MVLEKGYLANPSHRVRALWSIAATTRIPYRCYIGFDKTPIVPPLIDLTNELNPLAFCLSARLASLRGGSRHDGFGAYSLHRRACESTDLTLPLLTAPFTLSSFAICPSVLSSGPLHLRPYGSPVYC